MVGAPTDLTVCERCCRCDADGTRGRHQTWTHGGDLHGGVSGRQRQTATVRYEWCGTACVLNAPPSLLPRLPSLPPSLTASSSHCLLPSLPPPLIDSFTICLPPPPPPPRPHALLASLPYCLPSLTALYPSLPPPSPPHFLHCLSLTHPSPTASPPSLPPPVLPPHLHSPFPYCLPSLTASSPTACLPHFPLPYCPSPLLPPPHYCLRPLLPTVLPASSTASYLRCLPPSLPASLTPPPSLPPSLTAPPPHPHL